MLSNYARSCHAEKRILKCTLSIVFGKVLAAAALASSIDDKPVYEPLELNLRKGRPYESTLSQRQASNTIDPIAMPGGALILPVLESP
jgi:hypothetical protein